MDNIYIIFVIFFVNFNQSKNVRMCRKSVEVSWAGLPIWKCDHNLKTSFFNFYYFPSHFNFFQINTHNYYNVSMFDQLVLVFTITQRKSATDDFGMSPKQKEVSGVLVKKLTTTQYVLIIIINFYKGSKSGIRKYVKIENALSRRKADTAKS